VTGRKVFIGLTVALVALATYIYVTVWRDPRTPGVIGVTAQPAPSDEMQCAQRSLVMEPSNAQFATARTAANAALTETIWPQAILEFSPPDEWLGRQDGLVVVSLATMQNDDGTWEWGNLVACAGN
jgi:hypothetical protein